MEKATHDLYTAAYLRLRGIEPTMRIIGNNKVIFVFNSDDVIDLENSYLNNDSVGAIEFAEKIKETRTMMYEFKKG